MTEKLLKQMIAIVDDTMKSFKADFFVHDLQWLYSLKDKTPFFWLVAKSHTSLAVLDYEYWYKEVDNSEITRFAFVKDKAEAISSIKYWLTTKYEDVPKVLYFDGEELKEIKYDNAYQYLLDIWSPIWLKIKEAMADKYADEVKFWKKKISVCFSSKAVREQFMGVLRESENPQALLEVCKRFHKYRRLTKFDRIVIGYDFAPNSFSFYQERNGECVFNGGIIYYPATYEQSEHWQIHT